MPTPTLTQMTMDAAGHATAGDDYFVVGTPGTREDINGISYPCVFLHLIPAAEYRGDEQGADLARPGILTYCLLVKSTRGLAEFLEALADMSLAQYSHVVGEA